MNKRKIIKNKREIIKTRIELEKLQHTDMQFLLIDPSLSKLVVSSFFPQGPEESRNDQQ